MKTRGFKTKYIYVAICVILALLVGYHVYKGVYNPVNTVVAVRTSVFDTTTAEGFIVRDESPILTNLSGTVVSAVTDGERIAKGSTVANVFSSEKPADKYIELTQVEEKIKYYEGFASTQNNSSGDISLMDSNIAGYVYDYVLANKTGWLPSGTASGDKLTESITNRKILTGERIDVQSDLEKLYAQRKALKASVTNYSGIFADSAGYFISYTDGLENIIEPDNCVSLSVENVRSMMDTETAAIPKAVGKIVGGFKWYLACIVNSKSIYNLREGDRVAVVLENTSLGEISMDVEAINGDTSAGDVLVVLSSDDISGEICNLRKVKADIRFNMYTGIKVPTSAIRSVETGNEDSEDAGFTKCVYTLSAQTVKQKKLEILYEGNGYVIASDSSVKDGYVRLYDKIITKGKNLYDGKILN